MIIFLQWLSCVSALIKTALKYVNELEANQIYWSHQARFGTSLIESATKADNNKKCRHLHTDWCFKCNSSATILRLSLCF